MRRAGIASSPAIRRRRSCSPTSWGTERSPSSAVNVAARLVGAARPNEALVSDSTRNAAAAGVRRFLPRRDVVGLRGVGSPVGVWPMAAGRREQMVRHHERISRWTLRGPR
ncbi:MAG TPA: hypothetical protein VIY10_12230 [Solirubrobacteraceae bacterium]